MKLLATLISVALQIGVDATNSTGTQRQLYWQNVWDGQHYFECPSGQSVRRIESEHSNFYEDRRWIWSCAQDGALPYGTHCYWSSYVNDMDKIVNFRCSSGYIVTGTDSYHSDFYEDRRFRYKCCRVREECSLNANCHHTAELNSLDNRIDWWVPGGYELVGLWSEHYDYQEDRKFMARICGSDCRAPTYTVYKVDFDTSGLDFDMPPKAIATQYVENSAATTVETTVAFNEKRTVTQTTSWKDTFEAGVKFSVGWDLEVAQMSTEMSLSYSHEKGSENSETTEKSFTKEFEVTIPPHTTVKVELLVKQQENAHIPFVATLQRTINGRTTTVTKSGTWSGVLYSSDRVKVTDVGKKKFIRKAHQKKHHNDN